jgi:hypothetical protein
LRNDLGIDLELEHEKVIYGCIFNALREITGRDMTRPEYEKEVDTHLGLDWPGPPGSERPYVDVIWKGEPILRVHTLTFPMVIPGKIIRKRKIEQLWKKRAAVLPH